MAGSPGNGTNLDSSMDVVDAVPDDVSGRITDSTAGARYFWTPDNSECERNLNERRSR